VSEDASPRRAEPGAASAASILERDDPALFAQAMCAPEPARARLMVLGAFDVELSRAIGQSRGTRTAGTEEGAMIARMRLQFWRDVLEGAREGASPPAHEVAEPLARIFAGPRMSALAPAVGLVDARELELDRPFDRAAFERWAWLRFGGFVWASAQLSEVKGARAETAARTAAPGLAAAFALRTAGPMARQGLVDLLPGLGPEARAALARGETTAPLADTALTLAEEGLRAISDARRLRSGIPGRATPAFLGLSAAERDLRAVIRAKGRIGEGVASSPAAGRSLGLAWMAATGRW
jgi:hypothetical protein